MAHRVCPRGLLRCGAQQLRARRAGTDRAVVAAHGRVCEAPVRATAQAIGLSRRSAPAPGLNGHRAAPRLSREAVVNRRQRVRMPCPQAQLGLRSQFHADDLPDELGASLLVVARPIGRSCNLRASRHNALSDLWCTTR